MDLSASWTPWRYRYIADEQKDSGCVFCEALAANDDAATLIVLRAEKNFIILNRYPYTSGHVMVVPYAHVADLSASTESSGDARGDDAAWRSGFKQLWKRRIGPRATTSG